MLLACRHWLSDLVSGCCRRKRAAPSSATGSSAKASKSQRVSSSVQRMSDDELSSLLVSEPQRQGWLALRSQHRPRNEPVRAAVREGLSTAQHLDECTHEQLTALVDNVSDYLHSSFHSTFITQLRPATPHQLDTSLHGTRWGGMPFLFADESWPVCEEGHSLDFIFQLRQSDYPVVLQHSTWVRPSATVLGSQDDDDDAGQLVFQFFCCLLCQPAYSNSVQGDSHAVQHLVAADADRSRRGLDEDESGLDEPQSSPAVPDNNATTHPNNALHYCVMRVIDPRLGASHTAADVSSFPEAVREQLLYPRYSECGLVEWREYPDYPSVQQDVDDIVFACPIDRRPSLLARLNEHVDHFVGNELLHADRMGGWAWWDDDTRYSVCPTDGCNRRLHFFYQVWHRQPDQGEGCMGVITQCRVHRHFFHFSWGSGYMN